MVTLTKDKNSIGTKWLFGNKINKVGEVTRNKVILVCKGYEQEEGTYYGEILSLVARLEGVKILLVFAA